MTSIQELKQTWQMPMSPRPIVLIGAGAIVSFAHLPAYWKWGLPVSGIYDLDHARSLELAQEYNIPTVYNTLSDAVDTPGDTVFDLALPPGALGSVIPQLPRGCVALIQKPLGVSLKDAHQLAGFLKDFGITASVNFQMQYTPGQLALNEIISKGLIGTITDIDIHVVCKTPWEDIPFTKDLSHVEIPLHSIHYLDWIRSTVGMPYSVFALSVGHPQIERADVKSSLVLNYGSSLRCCLSLNHSSNAGPEKEVAELRVEGTEGAVIIGLGYMLDQPDGAPETMSAKLGSSPWRDIELLGERHPDAFAFAMSNLQRFVSGEDDLLMTNIPASLETMRLVEACLRSNDSRKCVRLSDV
jgi:predicted dehydrogenase